MTNLQNGNEMGANLKLVQHAQYYLEIAHKTVTNVNMAISTIQDNGFGHCHVLDLQSAPCKVLESANWLSSWNQQPFCGWANCPVWSADFQITSTSWFRCWKSFLKNTNSRDFMGVSCFIICKSHNNPNTYTRMCFGTGPPISRIEQNVPQM